MSKLELNKNIDGKEKKLYRVKVAAVAVGLTMALGALIGGAKACSNNSSNTKSATIETSMEDYTTEEETTKETTTEQEITTEEETTTIEETTTEEVTTEKPTEKPTEAPTEAQKVTTEKATTQQQTTTKAVVADKVVALTYSDCPSPSLEFLLNALNHENATLFSTSTFSDEFNRGNYWGYLQRLVKYGSEAAYCYPSNTDDIEYLKEKINYLKIQNECCGSNLNLYRPADGGDINYDLINQLNVPIVMWSVDTGNTAVTDYNECANYVMNNVFDGAIIKLEADNDYVDELTAVLIPKLRAAGYKIVELEDYTFESGKTYTKLPGY